MIKIVTDFKSELKEIKSARQLILGGDIAQKVREIVQDVRENGDKALFRYTKEFDGVELNESNIEVTEAEIKEAYQKVDSQTLSSLRLAIKNITSYQDGIMKKVLKSAYLNKRGLMIRAIENAGIYVPGGIAPYPSSVLMCAIPAVSAGVRQIIMVTPAKEKIHPLTLVAAAECGVDRIFKAGGAQAIAALAYGTQTIPKVDVIAGPGNIYVTLAKKEVYGAVGIDMLAGPSEILIIADKTARADYIACDMLSQAEHDPRAASYLITNSQELAKQVQEQIEIRLKQLDRQDIARQSIENYGRIFVVESILTAIMISNEIAPEHLELLLDKPKLYLPFISNAGAVFIGEYSPEPLGDYLAGPNHVLPTSGTARFFSPLSAETFVKKISLINYNKKQLKKIKDDIINLSDSEGLQAHGNSIKIRFEEE
ncbi:MAG TPA: histidinol dehydrogenase [Clostridiales bacterium]|nr:histidinol dehydrogenase [Clostridiales bacterium]